MTLLQAISSYIITLLQATSSYIITLLNLNNVQQEHWEKPGIKKKNQIILSWPILYCTIAVLGYIYIN